MARSDSFGMSRPTLAADGIAEFLVGAGTRAFWRTEQHRRRRRRSRRRSLVVALTRVATASLAAYLIVWSTDRGRLECANTSPLLGRVFPRASLSACIRRDRNGCFSFQQVYTSRLTMGECVNHPTAR